jgi:hypothetical protein
MIYALLTLVGILFFGGLMYFVLDFTYASFFLQMVVINGEEVMLNPYTAFIASLIYWLPFLIVIVAIVSAIVIELRRKNPDAYFSI